MDKLKDNNQQKLPLWRRIAGWIAVIISTAFASLWAFWGAIENFHEGWYYTSLWDNLLLMFVQYSVFMFIFIIVTVIAIKWNVVGGTITLGSVLFFIWFFRAASAISLLIIPLVILGIFFIIGRPTPKKWAYRIAVFVPLLIFIGFSISNAIRVAGRYDDGDHGIRIIEGNGIKLVWAPLGPGWPVKGTSYNNALNICKYLSDDGTKLLDAPQNIWRLPTVDEVVRSMCRNGINCGGVWDAGTEKSNYKITPDKETPLWNPHSPIIYWWTATEKNDSTVYVAVYHGMITTADKRYSTGSRGFRAVKDIRR